MFDMGGRWSYDGMETAIVATTAAANVALVAVVIQADPVFGRRQLSRDEMKRDPGQWSVDVTASGVPAVMYYVV